MSTEAESSDVQVKTRIDGVLGKYRLIAHLGQGGMAEVHLATNTGAVEGFNKLVVLKFLREGFLQDADVVNMFVDEARIAARLSHPNVVQTFEVGIEGQRPAIVMEYLDGQPFSRILRDKADPLPLNLALLVVCDVLSGLQYAHELSDFDGTPLQLVHRDVSPHNVFVTFDGQVKLLDFGIAKATTSSSETRTGILKGKVAYMPPEQMLGEAIDRRADVFSVGVMLWEVSTGERLWRGKSDVNVIQRVVSGEIPRPSSVKPDIDPELERIIVKAMSLRCDDRYPTVAEMQADLEAFLATKGAPTHRALAKWTSDRFAEDRKRVRAVIDAQLAKLKGLSTTGEYKSFATASLGTRWGSGSSAYVATLPSLESNSGSNPTGSTPPGLISQPSFSNPEMAAELPPKRRTGLFVVAGFATAATIGLAATVFRSEPTPTPAPSATTSTAAFAAPTPTPSVEATAAPEPVTDVEVVISATPESAKLFLDGAALSSNPWKGKVKRDGIAHEVRAEADGYAPKAMGIDFERDVSASLALEKGSSKAPIRYIPAPSEKKPAAAPITPEPVATTVAPSPAPTATTPPAPTATGKPKRPIDKANPWEN